MELEELPKHLIAIGGGAVGLELTQTFARLGSRVTVLEPLPQIVPAEDSEVGDALMASFNALLGDPGQLC